MCVPPLPLPLPLSPPRNCRSGTICLPSCLFGHSLSFSQCAQISKHAGGIGLSIHHVRAANSYIRGTNGSSNGIVPMLRVFNNTARYVDQVRLRWRRGGGGVVARVLYCVCG